MERKRVRHGTQTSNDEHPLWTSLKVWVHDYRTFVRNNPHETLKWPVIGFVAIALFAMWPILPLTLIFGAYLSQKIKERSGGRGWS